MEGDDVALGENLVGGGAGDAVGLGVRLVPEGSWASTFMPKPWARWATLRPMASGPGCRCCRRSRPGGDLLPVALAAVLSMSTVLRATARSRPGVVRHRLSVGAHRAGDLDIPGLGGVRSMLSTPTPYLAMALSLGRRRSPRRLWDPLHDHAVAVGQQGFHALLSRIPPVSLRTTSRTAARSMAKTSGSVFP